MTLPCLPKLAFYLGAAALVAGGVVHTDLAYARESKSSKKEENKGPSYPNATRQEPSKPSLGNAQKKISKAYDLVGEDKLDEANKLLDDVLGESKLTPYAKALASYVKGQIKSQQDDNAGAIALLKEAVDADAMPNSNQFPAMYALAQLYLVEEKYPESVAALDAYMKASGDDSAKVLALKANAYYRMEKYQDAVNTMKQAMAKTDMPE
jgi:hypothetical protein